MAFCITLFSTANGDEAWQPRRNQSRYELRLITGLIEHHQMASQLASLAADRAVHADLQNLAAFLTWSLRSEITDLQVLLADTHETGYEPRQTRLEERTIERMASLSGEEFEIALMNELIRLHSGALRLGRDCDRRAGHGRIKSMCARIGKEQATQVAQLRDWLCQWHKLCAGDGSP